FSDRLIVDRAQPLQQLLAVVVWQIGVGMHIGEEAARHVVIDEWLRTGRLAATVGTGRHVQRARQQAIEQLRLHRHVDGRVDIGAERLTAGTLKRADGKSWCGLRCLGHVYSLLSLLLLFSNDWLPD